MSPSTILPVAITAYQCVSAAGDSLEDLYAALLAHRSCLKPLQLFDIPFETLVGSVDSPLPAISKQLKTYDCRNARLALKALEQGDLRLQITQAVTRYGAARLGLILGTST